jgi:two-component system chemotaxis response regulator CheY
MPWRSLDGNADLVITRKGSESAGRISISAGAAAYQIFHALFWAGESNHEREFHIFTHTEAAVQNLRILAVDDSPTMRRIIINTLKRVGFSNVSEAMNGKDALAKMKVDNFDFIITDWNMPVMDGLTFVNNIRANEEYASLPVLMVTTRSVKDDILKAMKAGVNSYIVKPFTADTLKEKIMQVLHPNQKEG